MSATQVELRDYLRDQIGDLLELPEGTVIQSRIIPRRQAELLEAIYITTFIAELSSEVTARGIDSCECVIGVAIQQKLRAEIEGDIVIDGDNVTAADELIEIAENIKSLFQPGGELRDSIAADVYRFDSLVHAEPYDVPLLLRHGVFTSVIEITFNTTEEE